MAHTDPYKPFLRVERFRLRCRAEADIHLPSFAGSALRGVFGRGLKRAVCVTGESNCADCLLYRRCVYPYIFETPPPPETLRMRKYPAAPHPFVLAASLSQPRKIPAQQVFTVELALIGRAFAHLPYVVEALRNAGRRGLGRTRGRFRVTAVDQESTGSLATSNSRAKGGLHLSRDAQQAADGFGISNQHKPTPATKAHRLLDAAAWQTPWAGAGPLGAPSTAALTPPAPPKQTATIEFKTPMRLKRRGRLVRPDDFQFHDLFRAALRRISSLAYFHEAVSLDVDFAGLSAASRRVELLESNLRWYDWTRFSSRQQTRMKMGGLLGRIKLTASDTVPFWPYLWLGQFTHAGKGASMGLGAYRFSN